LVRSYEGFTKVPGAGLRRQYCSGRGAGVAIEGEVHPVITPCWVEITADPGKPIDVVRCAQCEVVIGGGAIAEGDGVVLRGTPAQEVGVPVVNG